VIKLRRAKPPNQINQQEKSLYPFVGNPKQGQPEGIQMRLSDYLELVYLQYEYFVIISVVRLVGGQKKF
jgi:hypothetical protein